MTLTRKICALALGGVATSSASAFVASTFKVENKETIVNADNSQDKKAGYLEWVPNKGLGGNDSSYSGNRGESMDIF